MKKTFLALKKTQQSWSHSCSTILNVSHVKMPLNTIWPSLLICPFYTHFSVFYFRSPVLPRACVDKNPRSSRTLVKHCATPAGRETSARLSLTLYHLCMCDHEGFVCKHQRARNLKFGNVLWTFCSAGSLTLIPGFDDPAPSLHRNMSMQVCVFPRAGTHVCLCVGGHPTLKVQLLLSPLSPNFFSLFPRHSWLQRPPLPDSLSS